MDTKGKVDKKLLAEVGVDLSWSSSVGHPNIHFAPMYSISNKNEFSVKNLTFNPEVTLNIKEFQSIPFNLCIWTSATRILVLTDIFTIIHLARYNFKACSNCK